MGVSPMCVDVPADALTPRCCAPWRHTPAFRAHLDHNRHLLYDQGATTLLHLVSQSAAILTERLHDPRLAPRAISTILSAAKISNHLSCPQDLYPIDPIPRRRRR